MPKYEVTWLEHITYEIEASCPEEAEEKAFKQDWDDRHDWGEVVEGSVVTTEVTDTEVADE